MARHRRDRRAAARVGRLLALDSLLWILVGPIVGLAVGMLLSRLSSSAEDDDGL